jgi:hypothetical protein
MFFSSIRSPTSSIPEIRTTAVGAPFSNFTYRKAMGMASNNDNPRGSFFNVQGSFAASSLLLFSLSSPASTTTNWPWSFAYLV